MQVHFPHLVAVTKKYTYLSFTCWTANTSNWGILGKQIVAAPAACESSGCGGGVVVVVVVVMKPMKAYR